MTRFAQVIIDVSHSQLDRVFEYAIPNEIEEVLCSGYRVLVPFGKGNTKTEGFVLDIHKDPIFPVERIKTIIDALDTYPVLRANQIILAKQMKDKYVCNLVDSLRLMIPAQLRGGRIKAKNVRTWQITLNEKQYNEAVKSFYTASGKCKAPNQKELLSFLFEWKETPISEVNEHLPQATSAAKALIQKGWIAVKSYEVFRNPYKKISNQLLEAPQATPDQATVIQKVNESIAQSIPKAFILRGVTGSGKTEVYLRCIFECIEMEKSAILLVPEIALTPQMVEQFRSRFGDAIAVLHSRLSHGERYDEWRRIRLGQVQIVVGARSAVFAPIENLGIIIIDEEHESSYQSEHAPRYHATEIARMRCEQENATLLLGSATPSIETWYRALAGEYEILSLPERVNQKPLPPVEVVDMREELAQGNKSMFSSPLYKKMRKCYFENQQSILFINRRGYSTFVSCRSCGEVLKCKHCDVSMTYHKTDDTVRCHYCDAIHKIPCVCPACKQPTLKHFGVGTQQVEEQVQKLFPGIRTLRMDYDTTKTKDAHADILQSFRNKKADVLIGTQMIAKGLDFPEVTLVGVIAADATLFVPDYRSAERAFQLITQVAGRAGRDQWDGTVVVQTYSPEHPSIVLSAKHDFLSFYDYEINCRKESEFPPFADFVRFLFIGENEENTKMHCMAFKEALHEKLEVFMSKEHIDRKTLLYTSAHEAPLHYLRNMYRYQVVIKLKRNEEGMQLLEQISAFYQQKREEGYCPLLEINPQNMA